MDIPEPLPPGTRIWSSGSGWIPAGGRRSRADKGTIIATLCYANVNAAYPNEKPEMSWLYEVRWDDFDHNTHRYGHCLRPIDDVLDALADIGD